MVIFYGQIQADIDAHLCSQSFEAFDTNLELTHSSAIDFIDNDALGCARSLIPDSLCAVAKMMEETFLKFPKGSE